MFEVVMFWFTAARREIWGYYQLSRTFFPFNPAIPPLLSNGVPQGLSSALIQHLHSLRAGSLVWTGGRNRELATEKNGALPTLFLASPVLGTQTSEPARRLTSFWIIFHMLLRRALCPVTMTTFKSFTLTMNSPKLKKQSAMILLVLIYGLREVV